MLAARDVKMGRKRCIHICINYLVSVCGNNFIISLFSCLSKASDVSDADPDDILKNIKVIYESSENKDKAHVCCCLATDLPGVSCVSVDSCTGLG